MLFVKRIFKRGQRVKNKKTGKVMEVLNYIKLKSKIMVRCAWYDLDAKEMRINTYDEDKLLKAS